MAKMRGAGDGGLWWGSKNWMNLGQIENDKGATGPQHQGMVWVGTRGAYYPLNHRWGCHPLPTTISRWLAVNGAYNNTEIDADPFSPQNHCTSPLWCSMTAAW